MRSRYRRLRNIPVLICIQMYYLSVFEFSLSETDEMPRRGMIALDPQLDILAVVL